MGRLGLAIVALLGQGAVAAAETTQIAPQLPPQLPGNEYPTVARADYVFALYAGQWANARGLGTLLVLD